MQALILAAILNYPVTPLCQQWVHRMEQNSRYAARLVWSPQKQRHIKRTDQAAAKVRQHCAVAADQAEVLVVSEPLVSTAVSGVDF